MSLKFISNDTSSNNSDQFNMKLDLTWIISGWNLKTDIIKKIYSLDEIDPIFIWQFKPSLLRSLVFSWLVNYVRSQRKGQKSGYIIPPLKYKTLAEQNRGMFESQIILRSLEQEN